MTTRTSPPQLAFSSGEISPLLWRRSDYQRYQTGLRSCNGYIPLRQGGFTRAPGTLHLGTTHENRPARLIRFEFAANDALVIELTEFVMRFWRYGELVRVGLDPSAAPYVLAHPYDWPAIEQLQFVQSADVIYLTDGALPVQKLSRFALDSWTIADLVLSTGPFRVGNDDDDLQIQASAASGTNITLTATGDLFAADHVGSLLRLEPEDFSSIATWTQDTSVSADALMRNDGKTYRVTLNVNTGFVPPIHDRGFELVRHGNAARWEFMDDGVGVVRITQVIGPQEARADVVRRLPKPVVDNPTSRWSEGAWSDRYGYPACIEIHDQRLVMAATPFEPRTVWFSTIGDYVDFAPSVEADESFAYTIAGDASQNRIQWLKSGQRGLYIGALGEEYSVRSDQRGQAIGPTVARFGMDSQIGSSPVRPIAPDGHPVFVSRDGRRIFEIAYVFERDANQSIELSLPAEHIPATGIAQIVWQSAPARLAWMRRFDGVLALMIHDPQEDVLGWARQTLAGGKAVSLSVSPEPGFDRLMMVVARDFGAGVQYFVEQQAHTPRADPEDDAVFFFSAVRFTFENAQDTFSVPHLEGARVMVWSDGLKYDIDVAQGGEIVLPVAVTSAIVGLFDDSHDAETLDVSASAQDGNTLGRLKRLHAAGGIAVHETAQGFFQTITRDLGQPDIVQAPQTIIKLPVGSPITERFTGVAKMELTTGQGREVSIRFLPYGNAPMTITGAVPRVQEAG